MSVTRKKMFPFLILALAGAISFGLNYCVVTVDRGTREVPPITLRAINTYPQSYQMVVASQGTVSPLIQSRIISEVSGMITNLSENLIAGGGFEVDELLIEIDKNDYLDALQRAQAEYDFAFAEQSRSQSLAIDDLASMAELDQKIRSLRLAEANLERAKRDLNRTLIYAPFIGTIISEEIDLGQFVNRGTLLATIYSNNSLQIRLPVPSEQLGYIFDNSASEDQTRAIKIYGNYAGTSYEWVAHLNSSEAELDARSQMTYLLGRIEENIENGLYSLPPVGLFLNAEIQGLIVPSLIKINRSALRADGTVSTVDIENRLVYEAPSIYRVYGDDIYIDAETLKNLKIILSSTSLLVEGTSVNPVTE